MLDCKIDRARNEAFRVSGMMQRQGFLDIRAVRQALYEMHISSAMLR